MEANGTEMQANKKLQSLGSAQRKFNFATKQQNSSKPPRPQSSVQTEKVTDSCCVGPGMM